MKIEKGKMTLCRNCASRKVGDGPRNNAGRKRRNILF